jgi:hypothetical protein
LGGEAGVEGYSYTDKGPSGKVIYYRIKAVDLDGKVLYSPVVRVELAGDNGSNFSVRPNPATSILSVDHPPAGDAGMLEIISADGRKLRAIELLQGTVSTQVDVQFLTPGIYFLRFINDSKVVTTGFVKNGGR